MKSFIANLVRALRLPFVSASALAFIFGSLISRHSFNPAIFLLGLTTAVSTHLSANLINDYADSRDGTDWLDKKFYGFFGGSKLIQEGVFSQKFYFVLAALLALLSFFAVASLAIILKNGFILAAFLAIIVLSWAYSMKPLQFSYNKAGEIAIFIFFGPVAVMGGYFLQTGIFPDMKSFALSMPFGFLTTAILYANEIPDLADDKKCGKFTWVSAVGSSRAYLVYYALMVFAFLSIILNVANRFIAPIALLALFLIFIAHKATTILKNNPYDKERLVESSKLTIAVHTLASLILIAGILL
jgi:1,4-dihydroxy-2-naphthoate octaprenyltransferase